VFSYLDKALHKCYYRFPNGNKLVMNHKTNKASEGDCELPVDRSKLAFRVQTSFEELALCRTVITAYVTSEQQIIEIT
jgi:hypothetical protein